MLRRTSGAGSGITEPLFKKSFAYLPFTVMPSPSKQLAALHASAAQFRRERRGFTALSWWIKTEPPTPLKTFCKVFKSGLGIHKKPLFRCMDFLEPPA